MNKNLIVFLCLLMFCTLEINAQKTELNKITEENVTFGIPNGWIASKTGKKLGDFGVRAKEENGIKFIEINCTKRVIEPVTRITSIASKRSEKEGFKYMLIDQVKEVKFNNKKAKLLSFTNTHLTEASIGGIYGLVDEGYTYTIEFYSEDNPEANALMKEILKSIEIEKPLTEPNIVILADDFTATDWYESEAMKQEAETEKAKAEAKKAEEKAKKEAKKEKKVEKKNKESFFKKVFKVFKKKKKKVTASSN
ncbi:MAG: hypothetical protein IKV46_05465 [Bacteroidales bacterium]|nr:hypothetical protein [Bacteroidales bacterium]